MRRILSKSNDVSRRKKKDMLKTDEAARDFESYWSAIPTMDKSGANKAGIDTINLQLALLFMMEGCLQVKSAII
ncbi:transposase [Legionella israelensis]|uniref:hypothetical protein n=1 Tax=Legionella israelensis TaxID=454 RepID=UPI000DFF1897|nr:hypothetical protein [Legionella israelensis]STX61070.1 transposase [Legionella israelensis]